ncbi:MAG TPA: HAD hydrolase family protein [Candidatus Polarisedimenticolia bacterium]|nr:HAD hydrolase family protein [Candidatus Polarisedimenticolia bacterium]
MRLAPDVADRARRVKLILMDVDGVLTDGRIILQAEVDEAKGFDSRDGVGIRLAQKAGLVTGVITGRLSIATTRRASELQMEEYHQRVFRKAEVFESILKARRVRAEAVCFIGDDLVDVPILKRVGLAAAPADARPEARQAAHLVTSLPGGRGAVRQVIDFILKVQGRWARVTQGYL